MKAPRGIREGVHPAGRCHHMSYLHVMDRHVAEGETGGVFRAFKLHFEVLKGFLVFAPVNTVLRTGVGVCVTHLCKKKKEKVLFVPTRASVGPIPRLPDCSLRAWRQQILCSGESWSRSRRQCPAAASVLRWRCSSPSNPAWAEKKGLSSVLHSPIRMAFNGFNDTCCKIQAAT